MFLKAPLALSDLQKNHTNKDILWVALELQIARKGSCNSLAKWDLLSLGPKSRWVGQTQPRILKWFKRDKRSSGKKKIKLIPTRISEIKNSRWSRWDPKYHHFGWLFPIKSRSLVTPLLLASCNRYFHCVHRFPNCINVKQKSCLTFKQLGNLKFAATIHNREIDICTFYIFF